MNKENLRNVHWETLKEEEVLNNLKTSTNGLSSEEAAARLELFGENKLPEGKKDSFIKRFLLQFNNALIYVLLGAAVLTAVMAHWIDTWVILGVIIINAIIGCIQEDKAEKALDSIRNLLSLKSDAIRDGQRQEIVADELVPGDVVLLTAGDKVPADIRLISVSRFEVDESALTGESIAVTKTTQPVAEGTVLGERQSMAYAGTTVRTGDATGVVVATAADTEVGKINTMLSETKTNTTPLMQKMNDLGRTLSLGILGLSILLIVYSVFLMKASLTDTILAVIGLAVAAIPEGLPAIITIILAIGVQRMASKNAIIRRLPSVETLGAVTVICSDKTGTLTKNEMTATNIYTLNNDFKVTGLGYAPEGEIVGQTAELDRLIQCADLCNEADIYQDGNTWHPQGGPTEAALKTLARKAGYNAADALKIDDIPFDSEHKYRATLYEIEGKKILFAVGAPDRLMKFTESANHAFWESKMEEAASHGQRLIGLAYAEVSRDKTTISHADLNNGLNLAGIVGIIDPPRPEAIEAIRTCRNAGICVKMITGDHMLTAREIAMQLGLTDKEKVISGVELESMSDEQIREAAITCDIFARTSPEHKLRLVKALQEQGEIVAMTGDGVNDAPALKKADIGIAMGIKGTEVTKDSSEMVLADDNFATIVCAVEEGRTIYDNIKKTLLFLLPANGAQAAVVVAAMLFGFTLPVTPVQILWANMVVAVTLAFALSFEPTEQKAMKRPPRDPKQPLIGKYYLFRIAFVTAVITVLTLITYKAYGKPEINLAYARTFAVNMLIFGQIFYLFNSRKLHTTVFSRDFFANKYTFLVSGILLLLQLGFTYIPFMQTWFETVPLLPIDWLYLLAGGVIVLIIIDIEKLVSKVIRKK